ncbi:hypothetical protein A2630_04950 [Candidatus Woesebacteria bacterium RIFCSPHIGHO2_01_FULL_44_10]|uniref:Small ribosomal subunit protein bS6 n=1 Tax=Candidatus Woesebacteria bacterium RIFCSPLOWO2_01_FULL_44_14 TaxID=1802525 RepID=A0A1F8C3I8_9BACT|nr:MAG: hypothetical protein A2630_04950 [Candidatus Woesebacteria bacterium RIFCSPHIGHO2_01_FULL_44_10]OGM55402.1 MAG: hypothetical protein A3F62_04915 [Candidatus Woesebacteria bacterium RIFCSPHIGHO2_12_FULL_44_11]OGM70862.1 MAG: hypothetical protein A2975_01135 [Candidatus Woesebacteria bacterium RIFCSPLOWO2_01_FULL_44_14]
MRKYELAVVLDSEASAAKKKAVVETVEKLVGTFKGKLDKLEEWKKRESGIHLFFPLELEPDAAKHLDAKLRLEKNILKYLLIRNG